MERGCIVWESREAEKEAKKSLDVSQLTKKIEGSNMPCFLLFGTGWGLHPIALEKADFKLSPIISKNSDGYNHLSVRSAVAIYLDRMFGS